MDNCKNTRFSSYNQYNRLLGLSKYRREIESTYTARVAQVEDRILDLQSKLSAKENEIIDNVLVPISVECQVTFLNPFMEGSIKNPRIYELPTANTDLKIKNGFYKIIQTIPNNGIVGIKCFAEDGGGGFLVPHENARYNLYMMATPHSNENITLTWNEHNGLWNVLTHYGHFEVVDPDDVGGTMLNITQPTLPSTLVNADMSGTKVDNAVAWKYNQGTYTITSKINNADDNDDSKNEDDTNTDTNTYTKNENDTNTDTNADAKNEDDN